MEKQFWTHRTVYDALVARGHFGNYGNVRKDGCYVCVTDFDPGRDPGCYNMVLYEPDSRTYAKKPFAVNPVERESSFRKDLFEQLKPCLDLENPNRRRKQGWFIYAVTDWNGFARAIGLEDTPVSEANEEQSASAMRPEQRKDNPPAVKRQAPLPNANPAGESTVAEHYYKFCCEVVGCPHQSHCTDTFGRGIESPQFRPLGREYARFRIAFVSENPGGQKGMSYAPDAQFMQWYDRFRVNPTFERWQATNAWFLENGLQDFGMGKYIGFLTDIGIPSVEHCVHLLTGHCRLGVTESARDGDKHRMVRFCAKQHMESMLAAVQPWYVVTVGRPAYDAVKPFAKRGAWFHRASMHWAARPNWRSRMQKRRDAIAADLAAFMSHLEAGNSADTFQGDQKLSQWPAA